MYDVKLNLKEVTTCYNTPWQF